MRILRDLLGLSGGHISKEDALEIARIRCQEEGWPWIEPVHVITGFRAYRIMTNAQMRGGNVFMRVDRRTGEVRSAGFARR